MKPSRAKDANRGGDTPPSCAGVVAKLTGFSANELYRELTGS